MKEVKIAAEVKKAKEMETIPANLAKSYKANAKAQPRTVLRRYKKNELCQTDPKYRSSLFYRHLTFKALKACRHPYPHLVMVSNNPHKSNVCGSVKIKGDYGRGINLNEKELAEMPYGFVIGSAYHEAWHLANHDYDIIDEVSEKDQKYNKICQKQERMADKAMFVLHKCPTCAYERAQGWLKHAHKDGITKCSMADIKKMSDKELDKRITFYKVSARGDSHPYDIERALRFYRYSLILRKEGTLCKHHQDKINRRKERLELAKKVLKDHPKDAHKKS
jgi:hypothetical protein